MTQVLNTARTKGVMRHLRLSRMMRRPPLLVHLAGFALIVLIPALLFSAFLILQFSQQQKEIAATQAVDAAGIISDAIDREIYGLLTAAKVLASSSLIDEKNLAEFHRRTIAALASTRTDATLVDPSLHVVVDTRSPWGQAPFVEANTDAAETVFRSRLPHVSDVFFAERSGALAFQIAVPVVRGEQVVFVLAITKKTRDLGTVIAERNLPTPWTAIIKDRAGHKVIAALASNGRVRESETTSNTPSLAEVGGELHEDLIEASYSSVLTGWTTLVALPDAVIGQPILRSWLLLVGTGVLLLLFSAGLAVFVGRRIAAPILFLADQAKAIGRGGPAMPIRTNIEEVAEVSKVLAQASRERREAEEQNQFLMREMSHRAKNQYALIAAIARRAAKESASTNEFLETLSEALNSLARSADLLAGRGWESASLDDLVTSQLKAFGAGNSERIETHGPAVSLSSAAAQTLGLALHELATNAAKYGALSVDGGYIRLDWSLGETFVLNWSEHGGPLVTEPKRSGFGTLVTQKMTARGLGGEVDMAYAPTGVVWKLTAPREAILAH
ncbi:histidine kinase [Aureimonas sp. SA4125]|uniref:HWE histidine kinase domain-containing protein n=1 Tax=Aureimonas sp. SA4125 TaxID=2826993 RepID=UPI001CC71890|nr:HWE histidine kinase domain-containing protein [Aureimonas sp. SA4125]BDA86002.1 histidine kinase [Aureimonas sp. SA4125]